MKVGFFDSGLGGVTIFKEALKDISADFVYLADNKNAPYGIKDKNQVKKYILENIQKLVDLGCTIIVIACNTATALSINDLRAKYPHICFIGTEPAVKKAVEVNSDKRKVLVCATTITLTQAKLNNLITNLHAKDKTELIALDELVKIAENEGINSIKALEYLNYVFKDYNLIQYSHVVLGCTHFPLFKKEFEQIFKYNTDIIDGTSGVVKNLKSKLYKYEQEESKITLVMTEESKVFTQKFKEILQIQNIQIEVI